MDIVIAPDSFKGSLTSLEVAQTITQAIKEDGKHNFIIKPMADGGEGTLDVLLASNNGKVINLNCKDIYGNNSESTYGIINDKTAIIECAKFVGIEQVPLNERNPDNKTTYGIGQAIIDGLNKGCTSFIIGLGGSATNDCGLGMLQALGLEAWDSNGRRVGLYGNDLFSITKISLKNIDPRIKNVDIKVACDVNNPLCGKDGASSIYGPQKGLNESRVFEYDMIINKFSSLIENELNKQFRDYPGSGAAGGLGFAFLSIGGKLESGAKLLSQAIQLESAIKSADLVITGEGQSDEQTLYGKAPSYIANLAKQYNVPTILISGSIEGNIDDLNKTFSGCFSIINRPLTLSECIDSAEYLLLKQTKNIIHIINSISK